VRSTPAGGWSAAGRRKSLILGLDGVALDVFVEEPAARVRMRVCARGGAIASSDYNSLANHERPAPVISPRIDRLLENVDSNYASVVVAAKRARQINSYYHNLGEGTFDEFPPPMVDTASKNYLTIALEEVANGKIKYHYR
jgi:DNA-directed RNA polymerase subunit omega